MSDDVILRRFGGGPCVLCGHPNAEHRVLDSINERVAAGEAWKDVLADHGATVADYFGLIARVLQAEQSPGVWSEDDCLPSPVPRYTGSGSVPWIRGPV